MLYFKCFAMDKIENFVPLNPMVIKKNNVTNLILKKNCSRLHFFQHIEPILYQLLVFKNIKKSLKMVP